MEGTCATSPSPILACPANPRTVPTISDSVNSLGMTELSDANSFSEINSRMLPLSEFSTPKKRQCFSQDGIVCHHVIRVLRGAKINELPKFYILKRWEKMCKRDIVYDGDGNPLDDNPIDYVDMETRRKISVARNKFEDLIRHAKISSAGLDLLHSGLCDLESTISQSTLVVAHTSQQEQESFVGSSFPTQVDILTPTNIDARGTCSRIKGHRDKEKKAQPKKKLGVSATRLRHMQRTCAT